jgi:hypothetical protein
MFINAGSTRAVWKVTSGKLLPRQAMKEKNYYIQIILKRFLNIVTARIEALVSRNKFLYARVKEVCRLWPQPRFDTVHYLCDPNQFFR